MKELIAGVVLLVVGVVVWKSRAEASTTPACPAPGALDAILTDILAGTTTNAEAEIVAQNYDRAGCKDAASAVRVAAGARKGAPMGGGLGSTNLDEAAGLLAKKTPPKTLADIPEPLATDVRAFIMMLDKIGGVKSRDVYQLQQITYKYPASRDWIKTYLDKWAPGYPEHAYDASNNPADYIPAAVQP